MKLIIQIPCFNEEKTLPIVLKGLPLKIKGFDVIERLVIDDGSCDRTALVAEEFGVEHIIRFPANQGLARGFMAGIKRSLDLNADVIVNIDADNQYCADDIQKLVTPILNGKADYVIGARPIDEIPHFSVLKKWLQKIGSVMVGYVSGTNIPDAPSGFRAMSRELARRLNVYSEYTYTLETIIQAGRNNMSVTSVPIRVNEDLRPSRLVKGNFSYVKESIITIIRILVVYMPFKFFMTMGAFCSAVGFLVGLRFLYYYFSGEGSGHVQSVILAGLLLGIGFQTILVAFIADLLAVNRKLSEDIRYKLNRKGNNL